MQQGSGEGMVTHRCAPCTKGVLLLKFKTEGGKWQVGKPGQKSFLPSSKLRRVLSVEQFGLMSSLWFLDALMVGG